LQVEPSEQQRLGEQRSPILPGTAAPRTDLGDDHALEPGCRQALADLGARLAAAVCERSSV
jgi:hypothetical protein